MAIDIFWLDKNQNILILKFKKTLTVQDLRYSDTISLEFLANADSAFYCIYDFTSLTIPYSLPSGLLEYIKETRRQSIVYAGVVIIIPKIGELLVNSMLKITRAVRRQNITQIKVVNHLDVGIDYINNILLNQKRGI